MIKPKYHVLICTSCRLNGTIKGFCAGRGSAGLVQTLAESIDEHDIGSDVMVTHTGCFGICDKGPAMVVYPEGTWYGQLDEERVERIVEEHLAGGQAIAELMI